MGDNIFEIQNLSVDVFDMARKPIIGAAPRLEILKDITFNIQHSDVTVSYTHLTLPTNREV